MKTYRITTMVTQDVIAKDENQAVSQAIGNVRTAIGDFPWRDKEERPMIVTGISRDLSGYMVYEMTPMEPLQRQVFTNE
jgi:hypothetical protein